MRKDVEVVSGTDAVWVNNAEGCIGRFGRYGIDIHRTFSAQIAGEPECLACTHGPTSEAEWQEFRKLMLSLHGVAVKDNARPGFLKV